MQYLRITMSTLTAIGFVLGSDLARAEPPMQVDDAGTLGRGGMKLEGSLSRDDKQRAGDLVFGFSVIENVEIGLARARPIARTALRPDSPASASALSGCRYRNERAGRSA
jgi:hypothetical protein